MANPYRDLFTAPGSLAFSVAGLIARLPVAMTGIGVIAMVSQLRGDYTLAGAVSATFTLSMALLAPQVGRLVDRHGQARVLLPVTGISVGALGALLLCAHYDAPAWTLFCCAVLAGFMPSMAAMVRARWSALYRDTPRLHTAFALESVVDELSFVIGPALSISLCTMVFPAAGPLLAAVFLAAGVVLFTAQRGTEPPVRPQPDRARSLIRLAALRVPVLLLVAGGAIVGTVDVVSVAFADAEGAPAAAGIVVAVYAVGSAVSGLVFGMVTTTIPLPRLLVIGAAGTAVTTLPLLVTTGITTLALTVFAAGVFFAPTMIVVMGLVERIVPAERITEGMTWAITGLSVGVALGAAVSGAVVDRFGPDGGFTVAVVAGAAVLLIALLGHRLLAASTVPEGKAEVRCG